jgi:hypothetical protein
LDVGKFLRHLLNLLLHRLHPCAVLLILLAGRIIVLFHLSASSSRLANAPPRSRVRLVAVSAMALSADAASR